MLQLIDQSKKDDPSGGGINKKSELLIMNLKRELDLALKTLS